MILQNCYGLNSQKKQIIGSIISNTPPLKSIYLIFSLILQTEQHQSTDTV